MSIGNPKAAIAYTAKNKVKLIRSGRQYFEQLLELISQAKESLHLQVYIFDDDETGQAIAETLKSAAQRNVKVYLVADGYASQHISNDFVNDLKEAGVHVRMFQPLLKSKNFYFGRRLHHKVAVADAMYALVGGINISNRYNDMLEIKGWLDFALYIEGEIALELCVLCWKAWFGFPTRMKITPCEEKEITYNIKNNEGSLVRMRRQDWVRRKLDISRTYVEMLRNAKSHITILCSYFLPGRIIRKLLSAASRRGVKITVITAGRSDVMTAKHAERWLYDWLLRRNIELYEYQENVLHGKVAACDSEWMTIGSYNINDLSAYASIELNLDVKDEFFTVHVESVLDDIRKNNCIHITEENHVKSRNIFIQFIRWASYHFLRLILYLFTFYYKQRG